MEYFKLNYIDKLQIPFIGNFRNYMEQSGVVSLIKYTDCIIKKISLSNRL